MDDTAQSKPVTVQNNSMQAQTTTPADDAQTSSVASAQPIQDQSDVLQSDSQTASVPVQDKPPVQPVGRHPEHAPIAASAPVAEARVTGPDTVSDASDVADAQQVPDVVVAESQPEVPQELKEVGVEQGEDAKQDRPEEQQKVDVDLPKDQPQTQAPTPVADGKPLPMDYQQAVTTQKTSKIRDSIKWLATLVKYQWEQLQAKGESK